MFNKFELSEKKYKTYKNNDLFAIINRELHKPDIDINTILKLIYNNKNEYIRLYNEHISIFNIGYEYKLMLIEILKEYYNHIETTFKLDYKNKNKCKNISMLHLLITTSLFLIYAEEKNSGNREKIWIPSEKTNYNGFMYKRTLIKDTTSGGTSWSKVKIKRSQMNLLGIELNRILGKNTISDMVKYESISVSEVNLLRKYFKLSVFFRTSPFRPMGFKYSMLYFTFNLASMVPNLPSNYNFYSETKKILNNMSISSFMTYNTIGEYPEFQHNTSIGYSDIKIDIDLMKKDLNDLILKKITNTITKNQQSYLSNLKKFIYSLKNEDATYYTGKNNRMYVKGKSFWIISKSVISRYMKLENSKVYEVDIRSSVLNLLRNQNNLEFINDCYAVSHDKREYVKKINMYMMNSDASTPELMTTDIDLNINFQKFLRRECPDLENPGDVVFEHFKNHDYLKEYVKLSKKVKSNNTNKLMKLEFTLMEKSIQKFREYSDNFLIYKFDGIILFTEFDAHLFNECIKEVSIEMFNDYIPTKIIELSGIIPS